MSCGRFGVGDVLTRDRKNVNGAPAATEPQPNTNGVAQAWRNGLVNPSDIVNSDARRWSGSGISNEGEDLSSHVPHAICKL